MAVKKKVVTTVTYECDFKGCTKSGPDKADFHVDVPVRLGSVTKKQVLCGPHKGKLDAFLADYVGEEALSTAPEGDYDVHADPRMTKLSREDREKHLAAKTWAVGPHSTVGSDYRPSTVRGPAGQKVLAAYEIYLREQEIKQPAS